MLPVVNPQHVASGAGAADRSQEAGARQAEGLAEDPTPESSWRRTGGRSFLHPQILVVVVERRRNTVAIKGGRTVGIGWSPRLAVSVFAMRAAPRTQ